MNETIVPPELPEIVEPTPNAGKPENAAPSRTARFNAAINFVVRVGFLGGLLFTGYQYIDSLRRERVERSFELVDLWESERIQGAQRTLESKLSKLQSETTKVFGAKPTAEDLKFAEKVIGDAVFEQTKTDDELRNDFSTMLYFLNRVSYCATEGLCEASVVNDFFEDYAKQFWNYFGETFARGVDGTHPIKKYLDLRKESSS